MWPQGDTFNVVQHRASQEAAGVENAIDGTWPWQGVIAATLLVTAVEDPKSRSELVPDTASAGI
jgi:hypothetical protein